MNADPGSGAGIVEALVRRYGQLRSYRDHGVVRISLDRLDPPIDMPFETAFAAPDSFRFAFSSPHPYPPLRHVVTRWVVGSDGRQFYCHRRHPAEPDELEVRADASPIRSVAGVSGGASHVVATLLMPGIGGLSLMRFRNWSVAGDERIDGVPCRRIVGEHPRGQRWELVVETPALVLRAVARGAGTRQHHRDIAMDEPVDATLFAVPQPS